MPTALVRDPGVPGPSGALMRRYARAAGGLFLVSLVAGGFAEFYVPSALIVPGDAAATAGNIMASTMLLRLGFAGYLIEAVCDIALALLFCALLRPVSAPLALLFAFLRLVSTAAFACCALFFYLAPLLLLGGADYLEAFSPEQLHALTFLSIRIYGLGGGAFLVFYGVATVLLGYLIARSGYLPRPLGGALVLAGVALVARSFAVVLAPAYASPLLLLPVVLAGLALTLWLLAKGIDVPGWDARAARAGDPPG